jgi:hypothetical protein
MFVKLWPEKARPKRNCMMNQNFKARELLRFFDNLELAKATIRCVGELARVVTTDKSNFTVHRRELDWPCSLA